MNVWRWLGASMFVVILGLGISVQGQEKGKTDPKQDPKAGEKKQPEKQPEKAAGVTLPFKAFQGTAPFYQEMQTSTDQTMKVSNMTVTQKQSQTFWVEWTPQASKDAADYVVKQKIIGVKMDIEIGGNKISYDSTSKEPPPANPLTDFFKQLVGSEFTLHVDKKTLTVKKIEGQEDFINKLSKANPALQPLLKAILSEKALQQMADPIFAVIPAGGVIPPPKDPKDDKSKPEWKKETKLDMGPIGVYTTTYTYTDEGFKKDSKILREIGVSTSLEYAAPAAKTSTEGLPFRIASGKLKSDKSSGSILFDIENGRIQESNLTLELSGDLVIEIAGMTTDVNLRQTQKSSLKTDNKKPAWAK